uniref:Uncharacterized protein n=1 Tax=Medicago truncatula TaxID=3880 RepID=Q2HW92_MEDTR|nr:hypothetical protein MtrDRAFT_AC147774g6v1 [Medicago truncatula]
MDLHTISRSSLRSTFELSPNTEGPSRGILSIFKISSGVFLTGERSRPRLAFSFPLLLLVRAEDAGEVGGCSGEEGREGGYGDRGGGEGEDEDIL